MAALCEAAVPRLIDLRQVRAELLEPVLLEETQHWRRSLQWDFQASAELVRRFVQMHALNGYALAVDGRPIGYCYFVCEERKGLVGDLFVVEQHRTAENENCLLGAVLSNLMNNGYTRRVECQLLMLEHATPEELPANHYLRTFQRNFMMAGLGGIYGMPELRHHPDLMFEGWSESRQEEAAEVIAAAYEGHVDSQINDQYRSVVGARHFLLNIVQYPGCGTFYQPASFVAYDQVTKRVCGICLASMVAEDVGHITQICVVPELKGTGLGYELLRRALQSFAQRGCRSATLTVTAANEGAVRLYERVGFQTLRQFTACVWQGY